MTLRVPSVAVLNGCHYDGDPFWDGDQTLYELELIDGRKRGKQLVVVPRGDAFISPQKVARYVERRFTTVDDLQATAHIPSPGRRPAVILPIEPGGE